MARGLAPERLSFGYEIVGGQGLAWRPVRVFDDGQHVYIQMPSTLQASEAPALLVQSRGGDSALVNYRVRLPSSAARSWSWSWPDSSRCARKGRVPRDDRPADRGLAPHRADAPAVRRDGPRVPDVAAPDSERAWTGTGDELRGGQGERRGRKKGMVQQDKKSPHVWRKPVSPRAKS